MRAIDLAHTTESIARQLPDISRWVEVPALPRLASARYSAFEAHSVLALAVRDRSTGSVLIVGRPERGAIE